MREDNSEKEMQDKGARIDEQFKELFDCLRVMPKGTKEEKQYRFEWMKKQPEYHLLVIELMNTWRTKSYDKLKNRLQNYDGNPLCYEAHEDGIVSTKKREQDPVVFMEAVKQTIEEYTGINTKGDAYTFLQSVGQKYKQQALKEAGRNDLQKEGFVAGINDKRASDVLKLVRNLEKFCENNRSKTDEVMEKYILENKVFRGYTKKEIEFAKRKVRGLNILSIDKPISEDNSDSDTYADQVKNDKNDYDEIETSEMLNVLFDTAQNHFSKVWEDVAKAAGKKNEEIIKAFLARDILVALKLEFASEEIRKKYVNLLEPKCKIWCPRKKCNYENSRYSCFIRYGDRESVTEPGDEEVYHCLEQMGDSFYKIVLDNRYVKRAYIEDVQNYYDLFQKKLKPAKGVGKEEIFEFTDVILGKAIGKSKKNISEYRNNYERKVRVVLFEIFRIA